MTALAPVYIIVYFPSKGNTTYRVLYIRKHISFFCLNIVLITDLMEF